MLVIYANPVINAAVLQDVDLTINFDESRRIHRDIQAGVELDEEGQFWSKNLVYLMMFGDCMAREIVRRKLAHETNLVLQHPQAPFPSYWQDIEVPTEGLREDAIFFHKNVAYPEREPFIYPQEPEQPLPALPLLEETQNAE